MARGAGAPVAGSSTANSSPPIRATVSISRSSRLSTCARSDERVVAGRVALAVVDLLEVVDVDHQRRERLAAAPGAGELVAASAPRRRAG